MTCQRVTMPSGLTAIVCGPKAKRKRCHFCSRPAPLLCDWKVPARRSGTCDKPICQSCATSPAPDKDICPDHAPALKEWEAQRK